MRALGEAQLLPREWLRLQAARPLERLREIDPEHRVYASVKPGPKASVSLVLTPMQLLDRLAALIPPPRQHRHRYYGVLAPHLPTASPLRAAVTALAQPAGADAVAAVAAATAPPGITPPAAVIAEPLHRHAARYAWALLLARIYAVCPLLCPKCGGDMRSIAFITAAAVVRDILRHRGEPSTPPTIAQARSPPLWAAVDAALLDSIPAADLSTPPPPAYQFDQRSAW